MKKLNELDKRKEDYLNNLTCEQNSLIEALESWYKKEDKCVYENILAHKKTGIKYIVFSYFMGEVDDMQFWCTLGDYEAAQNELIFNICDVLDIINGWLEITTESEDCLKEKEFYTFLADSIKNMDADRSVLINRVRDIASKNMNELGFKLFDLLLCGHASETQQGEYLIDLNARYEYFRTEQTQEIKTIIGLHDNSPIPEL